MFGHFRPFSLFSAIFGHFWPFLAIFGHFWPFSPFLAIFGHFPHFRPFSAFLAIFGHFQHFLPFLAIFRIFGHFQHFLIKIAFFGAILHVFEKNASFDQKTPFNGFKNGFPGSSPAFPGSSPVSGCHSSTVECSGRRHHRQHSYQHIFSGTLVSRGMVGCLYKAWRAVCECHWLSQVAVLSSRSLSQDSRTRGAHGNLGTRFATSTGTSL